MTRLSRDGTVVTVSLQRLLMFSLLVLCWLFILAASLSLIEQLSGL